LERNRIEAGLGSYVNIQGVVGDDRFDRFDIEEAKLMAWSAL